MNFVFNEIACELVIESTPTMILIFWSYTAFIPFSTLSKSNSLGTSIYSKLFSDFFKVLTIWDYIYWNLDSVDDSEVFICPIFWIFYWDFLYFSIFWFNIFSIINLGFYRLFYNFYAYVKYYSSFYSTC